MKIGKLIYWYEFLFFINTKYIIHIILSYFLNIILLRMPQNKSNNEIHQLSIDNDEASFNKYAKTFFRENMDPNYTEVNIYLLLINNELLSKLQT